MAKKPHVPYGLIAIAVVAVLLLLGILPPGISILTSVPAGHTGILTTYGKVEENSSGFRPAFQEALAEDHLHGQSNSDYDSFRWHEEFYYR